MVAEYRLSPSDNELEIPNLLLEMQPRKGLLLPFAGWGITPRARICIATYHSYVDDYRFSNIWQRPERLVYSGCQEVVESNFSLFQITPTAYGLQLLYKKCWIGRWFRECVIWLWVDLNVASKVRELNKLGVPSGYKTFATRGISECPDIIFDELEVAKEISGCDNLNLIVYGGGKKVKEICRNHNLLYAEQHMVRMRESREEVKNG